MGNTMIKISKHELNLDKTLVLGQVFGWEKDTVTGNWYRPLFNRMVVLNQKEDYIELNDESITEDIQDYLDIDMRYNEIITNENESEYMRNVINMGRGIHILKQDLFEVTITFMISSCNNMRRINSIVKNLCRTYGDKVEYSGYVGYTFPSVERIYEVGIDKIDGLGMGFRAKNIKIALEIFKIHGDKKFKELNDAQLYNKLQQIPGIGPKIASCIMLFGDHRLDSFPIDTHINRIIAEKCNGIYDFNRYRPYNGIVQQYMFYSDTN